MAPKSSQIKVVVAAGIPIADAIKAALPMPLNEFADKHGIVRNAVSMCIHGRQRHERVRAALASELGVDRGWLDEQLDRKAATAA